MKDLQAVENDLKERVSKHSLNNIEIRYRKTYSCVEVIVNEDDERNNFIPYCVIREVVNVSNQHHTTYFFDIYKNNKGGQCPRIVIW